MGQQAYNRLTFLRKIPYEIIKYLANNNEELWQLLYYPKGTVGKKPLDKKIKQSMIAFPGQLTGDPNVDKQKQVFLQQFTSEAELFSDAQLRIEIVNVVPEDYTQSLVTVLFQCIVNNKSQLISTNSSKADNKGLALAQNIIETLNGKKVNDTTSEMFFDDSEAPLNAIQKVSFGEEFSGYEVLMSLRVFN